MCAASNSQTQSSKPSTTTTSKPEPKWMKMKQQNKSSAGKSAKPTVNSGTAKQSSSAQKPNDGTRNEKRARWAKKAKPVAKAPVLRGPVREYISVCCSVTANKPRCGMKVASVDPETGRPAKKEKVTGLGHFRCSLCRKVCKVKPQAPTAKNTIANVVPVVAQLAEVPIATA